MINIIVICILSTILFLIFEGIGTYVVFKLLQLINRTNNPNRIFHVIGFFMILFIMLVILLCYIRIIAIYIPI
jgi:hypothetical protein